MNGQFAALQNPPDQVWLSPRLTVGRSPIDGQGLFARDKFVCGTIVVRLGGRLVSSAELDGLMAKAAAHAGAPYLDTITVHEGSHLILPPGTRVHFGNHSCDPNAWHVGPYEIAARRDIGAGQEVTIDYATQSGLPGFVMKCRCHSNLCRGLITSEDWNLPDLQSRYGDHWVPALLARIQRLRTGETES
jgi:hypothetical protein